MVMNALTSVLDATQKLGEAAGHAVRICDLIRAMEGPPNTPCNNIRSPEAVLANQPQSVGLSGIVNNACGCSRKPGRGSRSSFFPLTRNRLPERAKAFEVSLIKDEDGRERVQGSPIWLAALGRRELQPSRLEPAEMISAFGTALPEHLRTETSTMVAPTSVCLPSGSEMQVSVHAVAAGQLREVVASVFPELPLHGEVLAVCTCQAMSPVNRFLLVRPVLQCWVPACAKGVSRTMN
jgi:hypothetical protein